jgi:hypothetical protein
MIHFTSPGALSVRWSEWRRVVKNRSVTELKNIIAPIASRYGVDRVFLFGSYARGDTTDKSDIDLRIDKGRIRGYLELSGFELDLEEALSSDVDVLTTGGLSDKFLKNISNEEVLIYESPRH